MRLQEEEEKAREERELKAYQERWGGGSNPVASEHDVEAINTVPPVTFTNKAFLLEEDSNITDNTNLTDSQNNTDNASNKLQIC